MASSPRWRYARKAVPSLEKAITVLVLLVLAGLAGLFVWDMSRAKPASPFAVDANLLSEAARPAEMVAAGYLLPSNQNARRTAPPVVLSPAELAKRDAALGELAGKYKAKRASVGSYVVGSARGAATSIDTGAPQWAFGLWAARMPAGAKVSGSAGGIQSWQAASAAGFWAGTYYVEMSLEGASSQPASSGGDASADPLAILLGEISRAYVPHGRPFAAEAIFPQEGLKADSLRLAADGAFGLEALKAAFAAEYESGAQVAVLATDSAEAAKAGVKKTLKALAAADPEAESEGAAEPPVDGKGRGEGRLADGRAAVVQAVDRFVVAVTAGEAAQATALLEQVPQPALLQATVASAAGSAKPMAGGLLPKLAEAELSGPDGERRFDSETLYEKIDGKAQLYLSYSFAELLFASYTAGEASLDVYIYDMGQADNAFGIYKAEESENAEPVEVGRGGYASGASLFFWKGKHYVNILAGGGDGHGEGGGSEEQKDVALKLAAAIAAQLPDAGQNLWAEQVLPQADRVAGSFEFRKSDAFGLDFLKDVFSAQYKADGKEMTLFVTRQAAPAGAEELLGKYREFAGKYGKVLETTEAAGAKVMVVESSGTYDAVFQKERYFGGVTAAEDREAAWAAVMKWVGEVK